ncbi:hypothetical protein EVAR_9017_1 [Eumeta japonica]|uniref:Uncharacterized protein n=1 Tax=Eumeta variegata TaxID=151549 RepID=A0A4C1TVV1_EUMVA|nr:hypothetical protein EVAR_9017_1 [Eumeta japonica]
MLSARACRDPCEPGIDRHRDIYECLGVRQHDLCGAAASPVSEDSAGPSRDPAQTDAYKIHVTYTKA